MYRRRLFLVVFGFRLSSKMKLILLTLAAILGAALAESPFDYEGYKVYRIYISSKFEGQLLYNIMKSDDYDIWSGDFQENSELDVMASPNVQELLEELLVERKIRFTSLFDDLNKIIKEEKDQRRAVPEGRIHFDDYHRHASINQYLKDLANKYPKLMTLENIGKSLQGRDLVVLKLSSGGNGRKPVIFVDGGIHAREWISPAVVLYIINQLVESGKNNNLYDKVDWYFLPVINADGYEHSHTNVRLWRKTLSVGTKCNGTDANRNFDHYWGTAGASSDECSETYKGKKPFSEPEALAVANFIRKYNSTIKMNLSFHSYGQYILFPWGYTSDLPPNYQELQGLGEKVRDAIFAVNGTKYTVGTKSNALYPNSGSSIDWAYGVAKVNLSFTIELPGYQYGFVLPPRFIKPVVNKTFEGVKVFADYVIKKYG